MSNDQPQQPALDEAQQKAAATQSATDSEAAQPDGDRERDVEWLRSSAEARRQLAHRVVNK